ncbi:poly [Carex littledalei]|uniref:Poly [ADP-ribose] polymerase n=1 Tax=Carex littledalei TaxID=544730 RepID=A0A833QHE3_9POAL|nr:poly [Carex littledalei]
MAPTKQTKVKASNGGAKKRTRDDDQQDNGSSAVDKLQAMGIRELRDLAKLEGVVTNGTKKQLIERLSNCINKDDEKDPKKDSDEEKDKKDDGNDDTATDMEKYLAMGIKELRELAKSKGLPANGSKKDIAERLLNATNNGMGNSDSKDDKEEKEEKTEKIVTATKKGSAVLDQYLPQTIKSSYHVLQVGDEIYDATLNQTNVGHNNNKFYIIQVLESDDGLSYMVFNRWGRVGVPGQNKLHGPFTKDHAISEFEGKFYDKTKNYWEDRKEFIFYPKQYTWLEMDYGEDEKEKKVWSGSILSAFSGFWVFKFESGSGLGHSGRGSGYQASNPHGFREFYTVIPHDFGFKKMSEFVIDTPQKLKAKLELVEALGQIEIATKLLEEEEDAEDDPIYARYKQLKCELTPVEADSKEFSMIKKYLKNTHAKTHSNYTVDIVQIFRVSRDGEDDHFKEFSSTQNRTLLWHGSRLTNWTGILSQGLRIAPPEAPVTGYMFGKGVYFADMFSKSANYCYASNSSKSGVLLLCEVALGEMNKLLCSDYNANNLPNGKLSTKGVGNTAPDESEYEMIEGGVVVPLGKPKEDHSRSGSLLYNEYIVYNVDQIKMRYLLHVDFNFNYRW